MPTKTEIANQALALLTAGTVANIADENDSKARIINAVFDETAKQVIRTHRWSCCIRRATLSRLAEEPVQVGTYGYKYKYQLPSDCLRFLDLNGEPWAKKVLNLDINGKELHTDEEKAYLRYVAWVEDTEQWDVLLAEAVAAKLAMRVGRQITKDGMSGEQLLTLYKDALSNARHVDAMEVGSGENSPLDGIIDNSPIINQGGVGYFRRNQLLGLNVNQEVDRDSADLDAIAEDGLP